MENKKVIFVNNTSAIKGGALTILKEFIVNVAHKSQQEYKYFIFTNANIKYLETKNVKIIENIDTTTWKKRIEWDFKGIKNWSIENKINPTLIISLQNTAVGGFKKVRQIIYLHQSIPYYKDIKWNILKKDHRIYWFYKNIYKLIIGFSIKNKEVIVQNNWMKKKVIKEHKLQENKIKVIKPNVKKIEVIESTDLEENLLFYPASAEIYKNHLVLINALNILRNLEHIKNIKLNLTISKESKIGTILKNKIDEYGLNENVIFLGELKFNQVIENYLKANIVVFPSYIETIGLPLLEAAQLGKKILVADLEYARETLENYKGAEFIKFDDYHCWAKKIKKNLEVKKEYKMSEISYRNEWVDFLELVKEDY